MSAARKKTITAIVLDKSGSMAGMKSQAVQSFNETVQQARINAKDQDVLICLVTFDGEVYEHLWLVPSDKIPEATAESYLPNGATAMLDAMGHTVKKLQETAQVDGETAFLVVCISDGFENASKHVSTDALREMVESCQKTGRWTFAYMGCSRHDLERVHRETGIPLGNMAAWNSGEEKTGGMALAAHTRRVGTYFRSRGHGFIQCNALYGADANSPADYTDEAVLQSALAAENVPAPSAAPVVSGDVFGASQPVVWTSQCTPSASR